jgi:hypothetical protein
MTREEAIEQLLDCERPSHRDAAEQLDNKALAEQLSRYLGTPVVIEDEDDEEDEDEEEA